MSLFMQDNSPGYKIFANFHSQATIIDSFSLFLNTEWNSTIHVKSICNLEKLFGFSKTNIELVQKFIDKMETKLSQLITVLIVLT